MKKLLIASLSMMPSLLSAEGAVRSQTSQEISEALKDGNHFACDSAIGITTGVILLQEPGVRTGTVTLGDQEMMSFIATGGGAVSFIAIDGTTAHNFNVDLDSKRFLYSRTGAQPVNDFGYCEEVTG